MKVMYLLCTMMKLTHESCFMMIRRKHDVLTNNLPISSLESRQVIRSMNRLEEYRIRSKLGTRLVHTNS
jgi:hypothetical protein